MSIWRLQNPAPWTGAEVPVHFWPFAGAMTVKVPFRMRCWIFLPGRYRATEPKRLDEFLWHECLHEPQWIRYGFWGFLWKYLHRSERRKLEAEAYAGSVRYATDVSRWPVGDAITFWVEHMVDLNFYPREACEDELMAGLNALL